MARPRQFNENEVLDRALVLFWEKGFHATSVRDLVDVLGINRASLYDTFGDKQALYETALNRYREQNLGVLSEIMRQPVPIYDRLWMIVELLLKVADSENQPKGCFFVNSTIEFAGNDNPICSKLQDNYQAFIDLFTSWFREAQSRGLFPTDQSPENLARYFFTVYNGLQVVAKLKDKREDLKISAEEALKVFQVKGA